MTRPRLLFYCQHLLGVGHLTRSLAICRALVERFDVVFVQGGPDIGRTVRAPGFRHVQLAPLLMDEETGVLMDPAGQRPPMEILAERSVQLAAVGADGPYAALVTELFPFGRNKFKAEILGLMDVVRSGSPGCVVACSVRDILVEKPGAGAKELAMAELVRSHYDLVLVHSDPAVIRFEETFGAAGRIAERIRYTGFVTEADGGMSGGADVSLAAIGSGRRRAEVLVSMGGGMVGGVLAEAVLAAVPEVPGVLFRFVAGPHASEAFRARLGEAEEFWGPGRVRVEPFLPDFERELAGVGVSISLAGYNTVMNLVRTRTPALVLPHDANREQGLRARRFEQRGLLRVLRPEDLRPAALGALVRDSLARGTGSGSGTAWEPGVDVDGAAATARLLAGAVEAAAGGIGGGPADAAGRQAGTAATMDGNGGR